jgi:prepilin-type N-terminal cleavage/methylation domain-containing protein
MKQKSNFKHNYNDKSFPFRWILRRKNSIQFSNQGFTLIELLVAGAISAIVILVAWSGLVSAMNMSQEAQARSARQSELNKALDFMTNEIRMARSINASSTLTANGTTITLPNVVTSAGVNLTNLGSYGTLGLYLERPTAPNIPAICPVGGPNAGAPPPTPADFDPVVYDIRPSLSGWLQPRMVARYGRVPAADGTINPCSNPVSSDPMVDALSVSRPSPPPCSGVLSGSGGFYSCVDGKQANLFFQSDVSNVEVRQVSSTVTSRLSTINPTPTPTPSGTCSALNVSYASVSYAVVNINWSCSNNPTGITYELYRTLNGTQNLSSSGPNTSFTYTHSPIYPGDNVCFHVESVTTPRQITGQTACARF